jgi:hypothetical protein
MSDSKRLLPEEQELRRKLSELDAKRNLLADRELELATLRARLIAFERAYMEKVGKLYVEFDELEALLTGLRLAQHPESRKAALGPSVGEPEPSQELKLLYRGLAKQYHPDVALDPREKERCSVIMAQVNEAYARGDLQALQKLSDELAMAPETMSGDDVGSELVRAIRKIAQTDRRLAAVEEEITSLTESDLYRLLERSESARQQGQDLLEALAVDLKRKITEMREQLSPWRTK